MRIPQAARHMSSWVAELLMSSAGLLYFQCCEPITEGYEPITEGSEHITEGSEPITVGSEPITVGSEPITECSEHY